MKQYISVGDIDQAKKEAPWAAIFIKISILGIPSGYMMFDSENTYVEWRTGEKNKNDN